MMLAKCERILLISCAALSLIPVYIPRCFSVHLRSSLSGFGRDGICYFLQILSHVHISQRTKNSFGCTPNVRSIEPYGRVYGVSGGMNGCRIDLFLSAAFS